MAFVTMVTCESFSPKYAWHPIVFVRSCFDGFQSGDDGMEYQDKSHSAAMSGRATTAMVEQ